MSLIVYRHRRRARFTEIFANMKNPWKAKPLLICATPIVAGLLQIIVLGLSTERADNVHSNTMNGAITVLTLFLPLISLPALTAALGALKTQAMIGWYVAGVVLNAAYCVLLWVPIRTLSMMAHAA
jgi:uncharacterized membrane protein